MANDLTGRVWVIDTADSGLVFDGVFSPRIIRIFGMTTAAHQAILTDGADKPIVTFYAEADKYNDDLYCEGFSWNGLKVPTLQSGTIHIYA